MAASKKISDASAKKPASKEPIPPKGSAAYKALVLSGKVKESS
jgi:hypothetical protein